jgi:N-carbamoylputrescine amidase
MTYNLKIIQSSSQGSIQANLEHYTKLIKQACKSGQTDLVVLPELFLSDYFCITEDPANFQLALSLAADEIKHFQELAKSLSIHLTLPFFEKVSSALYFNSMLILNPVGKITSHYRKMHIPDDPGFYEKYYFRPGNRDYIVDQESKANLGLLICWDQWFPEAARINSLMGADILLYPTAIAWDDTEDDSLYPSQLDAWVTIMRSHAIANNIYVVACNRTGKEGHLNFWGNSFIASPSGEVTLCAGTEEQILGAGLDLTKIDQIRKIWPFTRDRRTDSYSNLLKEWVEN